VLVSDTLIRTDSEILWFVDLLCAGAGIYDVARTLGDTVETTDRHYSPFVPALRDRVRRIMETGNGLELMSDTKLIHSSANSSQGEEKMAAGPVSRKHGPDKPFQ
jgi:hypothetical protein